MWIQSAALIDGDVWEQECEDGNSHWATYVDFVKMAVNANHIGVVHNYYEY